MRFPGYQFTVGDTLWFVQTQIPNCCQFQKLKFCCLEILWYFFLYKCNKILNLVWHLFKQLSYILQNAFYRIIILFIYVLCYFFSFMTWLRIEIISSYWSSWNFWNLLLYENKYIILFWFIFLKICAYIFFIIIFFF